MAKKSRSKHNKRGSKHNKRGSRSGSGSEYRIITQSKSEKSEISDREIVTERSEISDREIVTEDSEISDREIVTEDSESQIVAQDSENWGFDCFNENGILWSILSSLTLKEAARTCVLSRRWKCSWTYLPKLIFKQENILDAETLELYKNSLIGKDRCYLLMGKTDYFIQTVDSILRQHQGHVRVDQFHIVYFLHKAHSHYLDAWVRFAVASKAKVLYLHLCQPHSTFRNIELYDFPLHLLPSSSIEELYLVACTLKPPYHYQSDFLNRLIVLAMYDVGDTGDDINHLVSLCSSLERLDVAGSKELVSLSIPHSLSQLHTLAVEKCDRLKEIKVNALNVEEIFYEGVPVDFVLRQPSWLVKAKIHFITEGSDHNLNFYLTKLSKDLPYLRFLTLKINGVSKVENLPKCSSSFNHLKLLDWEWSVGVKMSHLHLHTLFDAAPFLEELKLRLSRSGEEPPPSLTKLKEKLPKHPHLHLKTVEISGFYFERWQVEIVLYILINATKLDSMTLTLEKGPKPVEKINETDMKSLIQQVPPNVRLVIL